MTVRTVLLHFNVPVDSAWCGLCGHSEERHNGGPNADTCDCACNYYRPPNRDDATLVTFAVRRLAAAASEHEVSDFLALGEVVD